MPGQVTSWQILRDVTLLRGVSRWVDLAVSFRLGEAGKQALAVATVSQEQVRTGGKVGASEMVIIPRTSHVSTSEPQRGCLMTSRAEDSSASMVQFELPSADVYICSPHPSKGPRDN